MDKDTAALKKKHHEGDHSERLLPFYLEELKRAPGVTKLLGNARIRKREGGESPVKTTSDFSYAATSYAGDHYRIAGDAGGLSNILPQHITEDLCYLQRSLILSSHPAYTWP